MKDSFAYPLIYRIYVVNLKNPNAIATCGSFEDACNEFKKCHSIDGGSTHLQILCPLLGWVSIKSKV